jgi:uncharacterized membrane protein
MSWTFAIIYCVVVFGLCVFMIKTALDIRKETKAFEQELKNLRERKVKCNHLGNDFYDYKNLGFVKCPKCGENL